MKMSDVAKLEPVVVNLRGREVVLRPLSALEEERIISALPRPAEGSDRRTYEADVRDWNGRVDAAMCAALLGWEIDAGPGTFDLKHGDHGVKAWASLAADQVRSALKATEIRGVLAVWAAGYDPSKVRADAGKDSGSSSTAST